MTSLILLSEFQKSQIEFWKPVPGLSGYDVSNFGRVRSWQGSHRRRTTALMLKPANQSKGYVFVNLYNAGRAHHSLIHRLVALAFIPNPENLPEVNHLTGIKNDNRLENLEWSTQLGNRQHAWATGLVTTERMVERWKLRPRRSTDDQIKEIRQRAAAGENPRLIAAEFGYSRSSVAAIIRRESYTYVA